MRHLHKHAKNKGPTKPSFRRPFATALMVAGLVFAAPHIADAKKKNGEKCTVERVPGDIKKGTKGATATYGRDGLPKEVKIIVPSVTEGQHIEVTLSGSYPRRLHKATEKQDIPKRWPYIKGTIFANIERALEKLGSESGPTRFKCVKPGPSIGSSESTTEIVIPQGQTRSDDSSSSLKSRKGTAASSVAAPAIEGPTIRRSRTVDSSVNTESRVSLQDLPSLPKRIRKGTGAKNNPYTFTLQEGQEKRGVGSQPFDVVMPFGLQDKTVYFSARVTLSQLRKDRIDATAREMAGVIKQATKSLSKDKVEVSVEDVRKSLEKTARDAANLDPKFKEYLQKHQ